MAEDEGASLSEKESKGDEKSPAKKSKKKSIVILVILFLLVASGAGLFFLGIIGGKGSTNQSSEEVIQFDEDGNPIIPKQSIYYDLEEFIVNLNVGSKRPSFLKVTVSLELPGEAQVPPVEARLPRIRDSFQVYLRELRSEDLQGSAGIYRLREELLLRINKIVYPAEVNDILFKQILVQ